MNPNDELAFRLKRLAADLIRMENLLEEHAAVNIRDQYVRVMNLSMREPHLTIELLSLCKLLMAEINRRDKLEYEQAMKQKDWEDSANFEPTEENMR